MPCFFCLMPAQTPAQTTDPAMHDPRPATLQDLAAIEQCARVSYGHYIARIDRPPAPMVADFQTHIDDSQAYVLESGHGSLVGFVIFFRRDDYFFLENVAVAPEHWGKGYGRRLIGFAEKSARQTGVSLIRLYTNIHMRENLGLYTALGYTETDRRREDGFDRVYFEKLLT